MRVLVLEILRWFVKCVSESLWNKDWIIPKASRPSDSFEIQTPGLFP